MTTLRSNTPQLDEIRVTTKLTPFLERALPLARLGIRVFPCDVRGKEPVLLESGKRLSPLKHANRFEETIKAQWSGREYADCNIGCFFPRAAQNNFVVDIDSLSACAKVLGRPLSLSGVAEVQSSTPDKRHAYFSGKLPDWFWAFNADYTDATGNKHELFSVRNKNRYTVGPGSIHPSGVTYSWLNGEPAELPPVNEALLRELQQIAEISGCKRPDPKADGAPMPAEQYEAWVENLRDNFERLGLPDYEERISRRHGGIEFVFHPCPLGEHSNGNNTGLISVAPSGKLGWHCFHSSHSKPWREARKAIEEETGQKFVFSKPEDEMAGGEPAVDWFQCSVSAGQLIKMDIPERETLVTARGTPLFFRSSLNMLTAPRGVGKTLVALELSRMLTCGGEALDCFKATRPYRVFYFDGELPLSQMQGRIRSFGVNAEQPENFRLLNPELLPAKKWEPFTDRTAWKQATHALEKFRADVVIFDSLSTLFRFNTNDQDQWLIVNPMLLELRFAGYCVLILNHTGKDSAKGPRGSSQQEDLLDVSVVLDKFPNWEPGDDLAAQWRYTKVRAGGRLPAFDVIVDRDPDDGKPLWQINPDTEAKQEARELLAAGKGIHTVAKKTGLTEWSVKKLREQMKAESLMKLNKKSAERSG